jgi:hypothetical protein
LRAVTGHIAGYRVIDVLGALPTEALAGWRALVSSIDSEREPSALPTLRGALASLKIDYAVSGRCVVLNLTDLFQLASDGNYFTGFDELWLIPSGPLAVASEVERITADAEMDDEVARAAAAWMVENGSKLGLGDGDGTNWVTNDPDLAVLLSALPEDARSDSLTFDELRTIVAAALEQAEARLGQTIAFRSDSYWSITSPCAIVAEPELAMGSVVDDLVDLRGAAADVAAGEVDPLLAWHTLDHLAGLFAVLAAEALNSR